MDTAPRLAYDVGVAGLASGPVRQVQMLPLPVTRRWRHAFLLLLPACWLALVLFTYYWSFQASLERLRKDSAQQLDFYAASLSSTLERYEHLPEVLAQESRLTEVLMQPDSPERQAAANRYLSVVARSAHIGTAFLLDSRGLTLAASNAGTPQSFVGHLYTFRPYYQEAMMGRTGHFYAVGATTGEPGYFISSPVWKDGRIAGVVVVKMVLDSFESALNRSGKQLALADAAGVVFLSAVPEWRYRTLQPVPADVAMRLSSTRQYGGHPLEPLASGLPADLSRPQLVSFPAVQDSRVLLQARHIGPLNWKMLLFTDPWQARQTAGLEASLAGLASALMAAVAYLFWQRHRRKAERPLAADELRATHARLESKVIERTAELQQRLAQLETTERILRETRDDAIQAGKLAALGQMAAGLTHELNQPLAALTTLSANARVLLARDQIGEARENLDLIEQTAQRMGQIITQLKAFARKAPAELAPVRLSEAIAQAMCLVGTRAHRLGAQVDIDLQPATLLVQAEPIRLGQILINLLSNALDALAEVAGTRQIILHGALVDGNVLLSVSDSGPGLSEDVLPLLFEPFVTTKPAGQGLGLGLALSQAIAESLGGRLEAGNRPEGGAVFTLILNAVPPEE